MQPLYGGHPGTPCYAGCLQPALRPAPENSHPSLISCSKKEPVLGQGCPIQLAPRSSQGPPIHGSFSSSHRFRGLPGTASPNMLHIIHSMLDHGGEFPTGGGSRNGGGHDDNNNNWFWSFGPQDEDGRDISLLHLVGKLFRNHVGTEWFKVAVPAALMHCLLYQNVNAYADASASSPEPPSSGIATSERPHEGVEMQNTLWEVQGGKWRKLLIDEEKDEFVIEEDGHTGRKDTVKLGLDQSIKWCWDATRSLMLPEGYPECVTGDYLEYTLWRMGQGIASQINGVLTTQALLYAVGLGKGAIPTAAAINWVLKDGIGYLSKIMLAKYGRHFDVHPKGWRLLADLIENASYGLELLTPMFPHLFVYLGAVSGAGRSAAGLIQGATRSCFYAGFAAQRNFAEVIAKGEAQGMVSKSVGIMLGIAISGYVGSSGPLLLGTFVTVTGAHMFCNLRSYQAVQLRTLNPYRASLVFNEFIRTGTIPSVMEVNAEEPIFTEVPYIKFNLMGLKKHGNTISPKTKEDAVVLAKRLIVGTSFANVVRSQQEADELFALYQNEQYVLAERGNKYQVLLKMGASSHDLLRMMLQACYLLQMENEFGKANCGVGSLLEASYYSMLARCSQLQQDLSSAGWIIADGLVSRPLPYRLQEICS